jgi:hypothetical protein
MNLANFNLEAEGKSGKLFSIPFSNYGDYDVEDVKSVMVMHPFMGSCGAKDVCDLIKKLKKCGCSCACDDFVFGYWDHTLYLFIPSCKYECDLDSINVQVGFYRTPTAIVSITDTIDFKHPYLFGLYLKKLYYESQNQLTSYVEKQISKERKRLKLNDPNKPSQVLSQCCP